MPRRLAGEPDDRVLAPVEELERVAFLLERAQAATPRVKAFRTAADVVRALPAGEVAERAAEGTLTELAGIGPRTAEVVGECVAGAVSGYRAALEAQVGPLVADGHALRAALQGDLHSHTLASDGGSSVETMARTAAALGHRYLAVTDHSPRLRVANGLSPERLRAQLHELREVQARLDADGVGLRLLSGIEVDVLDDGTLDQTDELLEELDVVVASVHSKLRMEREAMTRRMVRAVSDHRVDVLGHCTGRLLAGRPADSPGASRGRGGRPESEFDAEAVFAACAEHRTAVEVNARPERLDPPMPLLEQALAAGCLLSIDSDAHAPGQLDWQQLGCARVAKAGADPDRVITTWDVERLLTWTRGA